MLNDVYGGVPGIVPTVAASDSVARADYKGDGLDDSSAIQSALNELPSSGGKVLCLPGNYVCASVITVHSNATLEFSPGAFITIPENHTLPDAYDTWGVSTSPLITNSDHDNGNTNIKIIGAKIDFGSGRGVSVGGFGDKFSQQNWAGIWLMNCTDSYIADCLVENVAYEVDWGHARAYGILLMHCLDCLVERSTANEVGYEGFGIRGGNRNIVIRNCSGYRNKQHIAQTADYTRTSSVAYPGYSTENVVFDGMGGHGSICLHQVSAPKTITAVDTVNGVITVAGDQQDFFARGYTVEIVGSNSRSNDGYWLVTNVVYDNTDTLITVDDSTRSLADTATGTIGRVSKSTSVINCHYGGQVRILMYQNDVLVANNQLSKVHIDPSNDVMGCILLTNNVIDGNVKNVSCVRVLCRSGSIKSLDVYGNILKTNKDNYPVYFSLGADFTGNLANVSFADNYCAGKMGQYIAGGGTGTVTIMRWANSSLISVADSICLRGSSNVKRLIATGNYFKGRYGVYWFDGLATGLVADNDFSDVTTSTDGNNAATITWRDNLGKEI